MIPGRCGRIVVFRQGQLGDTLVAFPVIEALHRAYPSVSITYCTNHFLSGKYVQGRDVMALNPRVHEIVTYNVEDSVWTKYRCLRDGLRVRSTDALVYLPYSKVRRRQILRDWLFFKLLGFRHLLCFKETWAWTYLYEDKSRTFPKETDRMLEFMRSAGLALDPPGKCAISCDDAWAAAKWEEWGLAGKDVLAVCPGSKMQSKRWPMDRYVDVGRRWHEQSGMSLVVVGGPEDAGMADALLRSWEGYSFSACGATLAQTAGLLSRMKGFCGNDTGGMHLAALLDVPCVAVFSDRDAAELWHPYGERHVVLRRKVECGNCRRMECIAATPACLDAISADEVLSALARVVRAEPIRSGG